ncbi:hypothetical protein CFIMG_007270RA00001 [Ceratocystis fimbriata CBS 114723]|uniref:Uncharacterized protein n=1 Tax=Ceratocystis fimbriata CBS 114723 TaxID=1035309 RepID=A0A2C5WYU0_9PEZI|nr:hypothetical protein CFIMG_007270RA00001 [Ceratocystis fimbriata CBS 114723]
MYIGIDSDITNSWITPIHTNIFFGPSSESQSVTNRLNTNPWKMFLLKLSVTKASPAYCSYESTVKVVAVVEPREQPNEITLRKKVGTIKLSRSWAAQPKPIRPMTVVTVMGKAMISRNSGSYRPPLRRVIDRATKSLILAAGVGTESESDSEPESYTEPGIEAGAECETMRGRCWGLLESLTTVIVLAVWARCGVGAASELVRAYDDRVLIEVALNTAFLLARCSGVKRFQKVSGTRKNSSIKLTAPAIAAIQKTQLQSVLCMMTALTSGRRLLPPSSISM